MMDVPSSPMTQDASASMLRFAVRGMTCASCVAHVERAIRQVEGVRDAAVNLPLERADVTAPGALAPQIAAAIAEEGYEARLVTEGPGADSEQAERVIHQQADEARLGRDAVTAAVLTMPVMVIEMGAHLFPAFHHWQMDTMGETLPRLISLVLVTLVLLGPGRRFFSLGIPALLRLRPDMNALVALGAGAAFLSSTAATLAPSLFPAGGAQVYFESAAVIVTLILLGRLIESRSKGRAGRAIRELAALQPDSALRIVNGATVETPIGAIMTGDLLLVRPGSGIPVDGEVVEGGSFVNEAMLTGEPIPVAKAAGASLHGGSVNGMGALTMRATRVGGETLLAGIIRLVEDAQGARLPIQARIDQVTAVFVPIVLAIAAATFLGWLLLGPEPSLPMALVSAVSVLIIACPCAMGLATPITVVVATGRAARLGALFRKGEALERLGKARVVAFDKTGTLTMGRPELVDFIPAPGHDEAEVLALAAGAEARSEHPVARAVLRAAEMRGLIIPPASGFTAEAGLGAEAMVSDRRVRIGGERYMQAAGLDVAAWQSALTARAEQGQTPFFVAIDGVVAGLLSVADPVKPEAAGVVAALKEAGLVPAMISGDNATTARAVAARLGISEVAAGVLPGGKVDAIAELRQRHGPVVFVGDGLNDAPALAAADVGVAVGDGTTVAIEAADVVLINGDLGSLVTVTGLSRAATRNIVQNLVWAFGYNVALIPVAAGLLQPLTGLTLSPMLAAGAMAMSSVFVVLNALRLNRFGATTTTPEPKPGAAHPAAA